MYWIKINYILIIKICIFIIIQSADIEEQLSETPKSTGIAVLLSTMSKAEQDEMANSCNEALLNGFRNVFKGTFTDKRFQKMNWKTALTFILHKFTEDNVRYNVPLLLYFFAVYDQIPKETFKTKSPREYCETADSKYIKVTMNCIDNIVKVKSPTGSELFLSDATHMQVFDCAYKQLTVDITDHKYNVGNMNIEGYHREVVRNIFSFCEEIDCKITVPFDYCSSTEYLQALFEFCSDKVIAGEDLLKEVKLFKLFGSCNTPNEPGFQHQNELQNMTDMDWLDELGGEMLTDEWFENISKNL